MVSKNINGLEFIKVGQSYFVSSKEIAKRFKKRHDNIVRNIRALKQSPSYIDSNNTLNIEEGEYTDISGKINKIYLLDRGSFTLIVMGFTGAKLFPMKLRFLNAFVEIDNMLIDDLLYIIKKRDNQIKELKKEKTRGISRFFN
jgi:Rha family phage regulatory protein